MHGYHHAQPSDPLRLVMPPVVSIPLFLVSLGLWWLVLGTSGLLFHAGFVTGYVAYDLVHWLSHSGPATHPWLARRRRHHLVHHAPKTDGRINFGVSTSLWDHVFGTAEAAAGAPARRHTERRRARS